MVETEELGGGGDGIIGKIRGVPPKSARDPTPPSLPSVPSHLRCLFGELAGGQRLQVMADIANGLSGLLGEHGRCRRTVELLLLCDHKVSEENH